MEEKVDITDLNESKNIETQTQPKKPSYLLIVLIFILALIFIFSIIFYVNSLSKTTPPVPKDDIKSPSAEPSVVNEKPTTPVQQKPANGNFKAVSGDDSMSPLIKTGDEVKIELFFDGNLNREDIVLIRAESISRIVGLPGEKIMIKNGFVYINGEKLSENYLQKGTKTVAGSFLKEGKEVLIPENEYVYLGDNREILKDSRDLGFLKTSDVTGIVKLN